MRLWLACLIPGTIDAQTVLHPANKTKSENVEDFLLELLASGGVYANTVLDHGKTKGYSEGVLQRAANKLGVRRKKVGMKDGWKWFHPEDAEGIEESQD